MARPWIPIGTVRTVPGVEGGEQIAMPDSDGGPGDRPGFVLLLLPGREYLIRKELEHPEGLWVVCIR